MLKSKFRCFFIFTKPPPEPWRQRGRSRQKSEIDPRLCKRFSASSGQAATVTMLTSKTTAQISLPASDTTASIFTS
ncbi:hypothetical protein CLOP_g8937 [Closterium sp. NIES-67]|nr:hypothetical protein CLOP_g8937 [Closterium sp. NIES-67]